MKRFFSVLLCVFMLALCVYAMEQTETTEEAGGRVEIEFCVGDATLLINGEEVTVEKPYVVGEGVTLVPVRVITEAFGAEVGWVKETKTITLEYPDVSIVLQIGNPTAEINGRAETLLAAPELTENGFTMVPLRFISENFGAEVGYDNETKRITVVKEALEEGTTVEGAIESAYIGDSYYGWMMENPKDMYLDRRDFDGRNTYFLDEHYCWIDVCVYDVSDEYDFDEDYKDWINNFADYTLIKADKDTSDSNRRTMYFQAKNKSIFRDVVVIVTDKYIYLADGGYGVEDCDNKDEYCRVLSTFDIKFEGDDIYDLSNVKDGMRTYENEEMKFSIGVPENFSLMSDDDALNNFTFQVGDEEDSLSTILVSVYSKQSVGGAEETAKSECEKTKKYLNEKLCRVFDVEEKQYTAVSGYSYSFEIETDTLEAYGVEFFFELGEYTYNVSCILKGSNVKKTVEKVMNSFTAEQLDFEDVGMIMYPADDREGTKTVDKLYGCSFEVPYSFGEASLNEAGAVYTCTSSLGTLTFVVDSSVKYNTTLLNEFMDLYVFRISNIEGVEITNKANGRNVGGKTYRHLSYTLESGGFKTVCNDFVIIDNGTLYFIETAVLDFAESEFTEQEFLNVIRSVEFN